MCTHNLYMLYVPMCACRITDNTPGPIERLLKEEIEVCVCVCVCVCVPYV